MILFVAGALIAVISKNGNYNYKIHADNRWYYSMEEPVIDKTTGCMVFKPVHGINTTLCGTFSITETRNPKEEN